MWISYKPVSAEPGRKTWHGQHCCSLMPIAHSFLNLVSSPKSYSGSKLFEFMYSHLSPKLPTAYSSAPYCALGTYSNWILTAVKIAIVQHQHHPNLCDWRTDIRHSQHEDLLLWFRILGWAHTGSLKFNNNDCDSRRGKPQGPRSAGHGVQKWGNLCNIRYFFDTHKNRADFTLDIPVRRIPCPNVPFARLLLPH